MNNDMTTSGSENGGGGVFFVLMPIIIIAVVVFFTVWGIRSCNMSSRIVEYGDGTFVGQVLNMNDGWLDISRRRTLADAQEDVDMYRARKRQQRDNSSVERIHR